MGADDVPAAGVSGGRRPLVLPAGIVIGRSVEDGGMPRIAHAVPLHAVPLHAVPLQAGPVQAGPDHSAGRGCSTKRRSGQAAAIRAMAACGVSPAVKNP